MLEASAADTLPARAFSAEDENADVYAETLAELRGLVCIFTFRENTYRNRINIFFDLSLEGQGDGRHIKFSFKEQFGYKADGSIPSEVIDSLSLMLRLRFKHKWVVARDDADGSGHIYLKPLSTIPRE